MLNVIALAVLPALILLFYTYQQDKMQREPIPMQTAYTIPSIRSSKYGFFLRNIHRQKSLAVSSGMAAPKKAVRKASQKEWISVG